MTERTHPERIVVAGGGVGAVETVLALRALAGDRVDIDLVAPAAALTHRPLSVTEPFDPVDAPHLSFDRLGRTHGVRHHASDLVAVEPVSRLACLASGEELPYDQLVVATGARAIPWLPCALTFGGTGDAPAYRELLAALAAGRVSHVLFAVPPRSGWTLPIYELALLTTTWLAERGIADVRLTLATPDAEPLTAFGPAASRAVRDLLSDRGIELVAGCTIPRDVRGGIELGRLGRLHPDRIVTLPQLVGRPPAGLPCDADGFLPVDARGALLGVPGVHAVGDGADHPVKQGGLAAQQANVVAGAIAEGLGLSVTTPPDAGVLRGVLLTGIAAAYLRGGGAPGFAPAWSESLKIAAPHLGAYLGARDDAELGRHALSLARADAAAGDVRSALEWAAVAERAGVEVQESLVSPARA
jgi:sulfide:quinone oxidoreductase